MPSSSSWVGTVLVQEVLDFHPVVDLQAAVGQLVLTDGCHHNIAGCDSFLIGNAVAALAGHVVGIAVGRNGRFHHGFGNSGLCLCFHGLVLALAADHQRDQGCCQQNDDPNSHSDLAGSCLLCGLCGRFLRGSFLCGSLLCSGSFPCRSLLCRGGLLRGSACLQDFLGVFRNSGGCLQLFLVVLLFFHE